MKTKKISVIGLGYVGLPLLCAISKKSKLYDAVGFDLNRSKVEKIINGECPIDDTECEKDMNSLKLNVSSTSEILKGSDIFIICVPTPIHEDYTPDYTPVIKATELVSKYLKKNCIVIVESTINPGTCKDIVLPVLEKNTRMKVEDDFVLAHCPERIDPGNAKWNVYNIPRNVGSIPGKKADTVAKFYGSFLDSHINPVSSIEVAEATKIIENTFRDINIAYVNELAQSFDVMGIDLFETINAASNKPFAFMPHWPGVGVGGHCIAVDPYYLIEKAESVGFNHRLLKTAREVNNGMPKYTVSKLTASLNKIEKSVKGNKVAVLGLSYKANIGDLRESPSFEVIEELKVLDAKINIFDPYTPDQNTYSSLNETLENSDSIILCTAHNEFKSKLTPALLKKYKIKVLIDGRNCLDKKVFIDSDVLYSGIGR